MKRTLYACLMAMAFLCISTFALSQSEELEPDRSYKPLILKLDEDGKKYIRFITWLQVWGEDSNLDSDPGFNVRIRRSRFLAYAQISDRFLILTHFGLNSLTGANADPLGNRATSDETINGPQFFLHGAWTEFKVTQNDNLYIGGGLHYWNGLSRLTSQSTLNFMTLDNYRQAWATLGLSDQFARHLGVYAKGKVGKLRYTLAVNEPISNGLGSADSLANNSVTYSGRRVLGDDAGLIVTGYFDYQFLDQESNKLPYRVGSYLGKKKVFNIGAGFFNHGDGTVTVDEAGAISGNNVNHFSVDAFYDAPLGKGAINAYAAYYNFDYGENYNFRTTYGTGSSFYIHTGYLLPEFTEKGRLMPYVAFNNNDFEAFEESGNTVRLGANWFVNGHNAKITLEYSSTLANHSGPEPDRVSGLILQTHIFL
ncbi:MAG: porin [Bacteroidota bacterium]